MCRFVAYLGEPIPLELLLLKPSNSLVNQSFDAKEFRLRVNGDGFGVAWYVDGIEEPVRMRTITPAWSNQNLRALAPAMRSECILAHVRAASPGLPVIETNCHPFQHGRYAFCHNGVVGGFRRHRRALLASLSDESFDIIQGSTDSETVFAIFLDEIRDRRSGDAARDMADALAATALRVVDVADSEPSYLNLCVTDGRRLAATRFSTDAKGETSSLYFHQGSRYVCEGDTCRMIDPGDDKPTAIIASERLSDDPGWQQFPVGHVGVVRENRVAESWPIQ